MGVHFLKKITRKVFRVVRKMCFQTTILVVLLLSINLNAQNPSLAWAEKIGDIGYDSGESIAVDDNGNSYIIGYFSGNLDFDPGPGIFTLTAGTINSIFVLKLDPSGNFVWANQIRHSNLGQGTPASWAKRLDLSIDLNGNIYICGFFNGTIDFTIGGIVTLISAGYEDIFISKLDPLGNFVWANRIGSAGLDISHSIVLDKSGNVCISGAFSNTVDFDPGPGISNLMWNGTINFFIAKYTPSGSLIWVKQFGSGFSNAIAIDVNDNIYTTGYFFGTVDFDPGPGNFMMNNGGCFISKLDKSGNFIYAKKIGVVGFSGPSIVGWAINVDAIEQVYVCGSFNGLMDMDPGPGIYNLTVLYGSDLFILGLDNAGDFRWAKQVGGHTAGINASVSSTSMDLDGAGNIYLAGRFGNKADFDPGPAFYNLQASFWDGFVLKLDNLGNLIWVEQISDFSLLGGTTQYCNSIKLDQNGSIYFTGEFWGPSGGAIGTVDFDPCTGTYNLTPLDYNDAFIIKWDQVAAETASVTITTLSTDICPGANVTFTADYTNGGVSPTFEWQVNGISVGDNNSTFTSNTLANDDIVSLIMTSSLNCTVPAISNTITINVSTSASASVNVTSSATTICSGTPVTFTATPVNGGSTPLYQWKVNGINVGINSSTYISITLVNGDIVSCILTSSDPCALPVTANSNTITIVVNTQVSPSVSITSSAINIFGGTPVSFTATPQNFLPPVTYQWYKNNLPVGANAAVYTDNSSNHKDSIWVSITGNNSCGISNTVLSNKIIMTVNNNLSCTGSLGDPMVNVTFGAGPNPGPPLPADITNMQYLTSFCPNDGQYTITNSTSGCWGGNWHTITDHTGNTNGYFMLVNASYQPSDFYVQTVSGLCSGTTYEFSAWILNMIKGINDPGILPNITFSIEKTDGTVLQSYNSGNIALANPALWRKYGFYFTTPPGISSVVIRMRNNAPGGGGNDLALDDITFRPAGPLTTIGIQGMQGDSISICNSGVTLFSNVENCYLTNEYKWQISINNGNWTDIPNANNTTYLTPIQTQGNYKYRLSVAQAGNIGLASCRVYSNKVTVYVPPDNPETLNIPVAICTGQTYSLPWGTIISTAGIYHDTLLNTSGCDSLIKIVNLVVQTVAESKSSITVCAEENYVLPWGTTVNTSGTYRDTLRYSSGCDSLIRMVIVDVKKVISTSGAAFICSGQTYTLPWGEVVDMPGIYHDTIKYISGCDSLVRKFDLAEQTLSTTNNNSYICPGQTYTLPWGTIVNTTGIYRDTIRSVSGCDSMIQTINLTIQDVVLNNILQSICAGQTYTLPSGRMVNVAGVYGDTLQSTVTGCDSLITMLTLDTNLKPVVKLSKSNDINCSLGITRLNASGGNSYQWSPSNSLDNVRIADPVASPAETTIYHVKVTSDDGCTAEDSIEVKVFAGVSQNNFLLPNAFTPNNDGLNDCFGLKTWGYVSDIRFSIYSRWGDLIFNTKNANDCWNGMHKGVMQPTGAYVYQLSAKTICGPIYRKGIVILVR